MESNLIVSVIVPVYNVKEYLVQCLETIINQTYNNIEILLVDDGSTDTSGTICEKYRAKDNRIRVIHKSNGGLSDARNVGIENCTGSFILCVDSDDCISINCIELLMKGMRETNADISVGKMIAFEGDRVSFMDDKESKSQNKLVILETEDALETMLLQNYFDVSACAKLYKSELFDGIQFPVGKLYEDIATTYKLINKSKKICYIDTPIYAYRRNRVGSITQESFNIRRLELISSYSAFYDYVLQNKRKLKGAAECRYSMCAANILNSLYFSDDYSLYYPIVKKMRKEIWNRMFYVVFQRKILVRRKIKIISSALSRSIFQKVFSMWNSGV